MLTWKYASDAVGDVKKNWVTHTNRMLTCQFHFQGWRGSNIQLLSCAHRPVSSWHGALFDSGALCGQHTLTRSNNHKRTTTACSTGCARRWCLTASRWWRPVRKSVNSDTMIEVQTDRPSACLSLRWGRSTLYDKETAGRGNTTPLWRIASASAQATG